MKKYICIIGILTIVFMNFGCEDNPFDSSSNDNEIQVAEQSTSTKSTSTKSTPTETVKPKISKSYNINSFSATGIVPEEGSYSFSQKGVFKVIVDGATGLSSVRFSSDGYRFDTFPVQNGSFQMRWGQINGVHCPSDGYAISGHFVSPTSAKGEIVYAWDCQERSRGNFVASK